MLRRAAGRLVTHALLTSGGIRERPFPSVLFNGQFSVGYGPLRDVRFLSSGELRHQAGFGQVMRRNAARSSQSTR